jgi:hypothetical protein
MNRLLVLPSSLFQIVNPRQQISISEASPSDGAHLRKVSKCVEQVEE